MSDFDNVTFHISTPETKTKILISISVKCFPELLQYGAQAVLEREYGPYIVEPEQGYDFSVQVDLENLPEGQGMCKYMAQWAAADGYTRGEGRSDQAHIASQAQCHGCTLRAGL